MQLVALQLTANATTRTNIAIAPLGDAEEDELAARVAERSRI
jgi:hypothetical protein